MKKVFALLFSLMLFVSCAAAGTGFAESKKIRIVTTIFPIYDWVREIVGSDADHVDITLLLDNGVDLHSYQPTAQDILKISTADLFIYVGGESDEWVEDVLKSAMNPGLKAVSLVDAMGNEIKMEEIVEGMEHEHEHDHDEDEDHEEHDGHDDEHDHEHEEEADEHVWLSLRCARKLIAVIADALSGIDPDFGDHYRANASAYMEKLSDLDGQSALL